MSEYVLRIKTAGFNRIRPARCGPPTTVLVTTNATDPIIQQIQYSSQFYFLNRGDAKRRNGFLAGTPICKCVTHSLTHSLTHSHKSSLFLRDLVNCTDVRLLFQYGVELGLRSCYSNMSSGSDGLVWPD